MVLKSKKCLLFVGTFLVHFTYATVAAQLNAIPMKFIWHLWVVRKNYQHYQYCELFANMSMTFPTKSIDATDILNFGIYIESFKQNSMTSTSQWVVFKKFYLMKCLGIWLHHLKTTAKYTIAIQQQLVFVKGTRQMMAYDMYYCRCLHNLMFTNTIFLNVYFKKNKKCANCNQISVDMHLSHEN